MAGATIVVCNDYEFQPIRQKTGMDEEEMLDRSGALVVTRGEHGCSIVEREGTTEVRAVPPHKVVDPTGVGDAFRGGFLKGLARGASYPVCAQLGSVAATYALEHLGGQSHAYTWSEFFERYEAHFGHAVGLERQD
jgi:adenosine kinase